MIKNKLIEQLTEMLDKIGGKQEKKLQNVSGQLMKRHCNNKKLAIEKY